MEAALASEPRPGYVFKAQTSARFPDPLAACRNFPDLPGNAWPKGLARAHCELSFGSGIDAARAATLLAQNKAPELEALYAADQARHFAKTEFSEAIHGDFYFFDGGGESDRLSASWVKQAPTSAYAAIARGNHLLQAARRVRAARREGDMPEDELKAMYALGEASAAEFRRAATLAPDMIEAYNGLAHVGTVGSARGAEAEGISEGQKIDPLCAPLAMQEMWSLMPRWGGSREAMGERAAELAKHLGERPLLALAAAMPAVEDADQIMFASGPNWRTRVADLLRPYALAGTSQEVSSRMGIGSCCDAGSIKNEYLIHHLAAGRFGHGQPSDALNRAAALLDEVRQLPEWALADVNYVLEREPANGRARMLKGKIQYRTRHFAEAEPEFRRGMGDPEVRATSMFMLSQTLAQLGRLAEAREVAEQYHREYPDYADDWVWIQDFLSKMETSSITQPPPASAVLKR